MAGPGEGPHFRELLEALPLPSLILDSHGRIIFANRHLAELVGRQPGDLIGSDVFDLNPADERPSLRAVLSQGVADDSLPPHLETSPIAAGGATRTILWSVAPVRDDRIADDSGDIVEIVGVGQDVTERRALEAERAQLRALVDTTPAATMAFDLDRTVPVWNPAAERTFGWTADEVVGRPLPNMVRPEDSDSGNERIRRTVMGEAIGGDRVVRLHDQGARRGIGDGPGDRPRDRRPGRRRDLSRHHDRGGNDIPDLRAASRRW